LVDFFRSDSRHFNSGNHCELRSKQPGEGPRASPRHQTNSYSQ
jgi:hypothetical protein